MQKHGEHSEAALAARTSAAENVVGPSAAPPNAFAAMRAAHHVQPGVELAKEAERLAVHNQARAAMADVEDRLEAAARMVEAAETQARFFLTVISILYYRILYI